MALKDWRLKPHRKRWWTKGDSYVSVEEFADGNWVVFFGGILNDKQKSFKTKSQALAFAKRHMRLH